jgi:hypothetical protein
VTYHDGMSQQPEPANCIRLLSEQGFAFVDGGTMNALLGGVAGSENWRTFADSWNDLVVDAYLAEHGTFRRRRHAVFSLSSDGTATREPHRPHYQSKTYNTLQGGIERWFEPISAKVADATIFLGILALCARVFGQLARDVVVWDVEVHQFRIEAKPGEVGLPTPEGVHRDGVDFVLVALINRTNIDSGTTTIHDADGVQLGSFTLTHPLDSAFVDDERVFHGVTPIIVIDELRPAFRDVLVVTLAARRGTIPLLPSKSPGPVTGGLSRE